MTQTPCKQAQAILDFWFGEPGSPEYGENRKQWWVKDQAFDDRIKTDLLAPYEQAVSGALDHWASSEHASNQALESLALILLLDQVPRNIFRNTPKSFASDSKARDLTARVIEYGLDQQLPSVMRVFCYMPLEHSESLDDQNLSVKLFKDLGIENFIEYAISHQRIIERFGRFPHRNEILGRTSTDMELEFLTQPNSSF